MLQLLEHQFGGKRYHPGVRCGFEQRHTVAQSGLRVAGAGAAIRTQPVPPALPLRANARGGFQNSTTVRPGRAFTMRAALVAIMVWNPMLDSR